jgi:methylated-DNA-[protein]-cysteine S-methyltransferase
MPAIDGGPVAMNELRQITWTTYQSPVGALTVVGGPGGVSNVHFPGRSPRLARSTQRRMPNVTDQLAAYFAGERQSFELKLDLRGDPLQELVWRMLLEIPYGTTTTYGELAARIDDALYPAGLEPYRRARIVGAAVGRTPTPILVPCHRVIGSDGSLTGYGGGLQRKRALLELEGAGATGESAEVNRQLALL